MSAPFTLDERQAYSLPGYIDPEKLAVLKRVFEAACAEAAIPAEAKSQRAELAHKLLAFTSTAEDESLLMEFARNAVANYQR